MDAANAVVELEQELRINLNVPAEKDVVLKAFRKQQVLMMSADAWKIYLPHVKPVLSSSELSSIKKQRRRALGTVYARNSRGKQAAVKNADSEKLDKLAASNVRLLKENASLKVEIAKLRARSRAAAL